MDLDELVVAAKKGEEKALDQLFARLIVAIRPCFKRGFPAADIDDLIQSTLMVILRKLPRYEVTADKPIDHWARGIARLEARSELRKRSRRSRIEQTAAKDPTPTTTHLSSRLDRAANLAKIDDALAKLDSPLRRVILNDLEEGNIAEFAEREGIERDSVRARRRRARRKLRKSALRRR